MPSKLEHPCVGTMYRTKSGLLYLVLSRSETLVARAIVKYLVVCVADVEASYSNHVMRVGETGYWRGQIASSWPDEACA